MPTATAMIPYMWIDSKRNISWMRVHQAASDFSSTTPK